MLPHAKSVIAIIPISKTNGATASGYFDTKGADFVHISVFASSADVVSNTLSVLKISEGDTTSSFATFSGAVSGTDYTIATNAYTSTTNDNMWTFSVDTRGRKRYLKIEASPQTTMVIGASATLFRNEIAVATPTGTLNAIYV